VKEGRIGTKDGKPLPGADEPLHAYITSDLEENVKKGADRVIIMILFVIILYSMETVLNVDVVIITVYENSDIFSIIHYHGHMGSTAQKTSKFLTGDRANA